MHRHVIEQQRIFTVSWYSTYVAKNDPLRADPNQRQGLNKKSQLSVRHTSVFTRIDNEGLYYFQIPSSKRVVSGSIRSWSG